jgi:predicted CXXCH cytochrome family protein
MKSKRSAIHAVLALIGLALIGTACTDEKIVFQDRELFNPPPDASVGFLGYFDETEKTTTCGNCHVGVQASWENTAHADAWATLDESGHSQVFCEGCHTVNELGNFVESAAGYNLVPDTAYHDVQCESCHGPGLTHVENPDASQPLPSIEVDSTNGCGECHNGSHHPFAEEWSQSAHAQPVGYVLDHAAGDPTDECLNCHTGQGALDAWGVEPEFLEANAAVDDYAGITCAVCHDPHGSANDAQLRYPIDVPEQANNLCMKCHYKRAQPDLESSTLRGPHSPEGPLLLGESVGWIPPGFTPFADRIVGSHGSEGNTRTCAACHVARVTVNDAETGDFVFSSTGHLFLAIPCVDAQGIPTTDQSCNLPEREFSGCTTSGCHLGADAARNAFITSQTRIANLVAEVERLVALAPAGERDSRDGVFTVADGAWFNAELGKLPGTSTHNPFFAEQVLVASISALRSEYSLTTPPQVSMEYEL